MTGPTGPSLWVINATSSSIHYLPIPEIDGVGIGTVNPQRTLDVQGSFRASGNSQVNTLSENIQHSTTVDGVTNTHTLQYTQAGTHYLSGHDNSKTIRIHFDQFPNIQDLSNTYVMSTIMKGANSEFSFADTITLTDVNGLSTTVTPKFPSSVSDIQSQVSEKSSSDFILQQMTYLYLDGSGHVLSNISTFM